MEQIVYVKEMIENFISNLSRQALFIKHYDTEQIHKAEFMQLLPNSPSVTCLYHEYQANTMYEAYEPFLEWIRFCYIHFYKDTITAEDFLTQCQVYSLHVEPLANYLTSGICKRNEDLIFTELNFETANIFLDFLR